MTARKVSLWLTTGIVLCALVVLFGLYAGTYSQLVRRVERVHFAPLGRGGMEYTLFHEASYGDTKHWWDRLFGPMHWLDRRIRPQMWKDPPQYNYLKQQPEKRNSP